MNFRHALVFVWCLTALMRAACADAAFWVWNRGTPLTEAERGTLAEAGVRTLYWHFAEIVNDDGTWEWKRAPKLPEKSGAALRIVPVIRLEATAREPFAAAAVAPLVAKLSAAFQSVEAQEWQLDYDSPDRLVGDYSRFLKTLRAGAPTLTSTALAGWVRLPAFAELQESVAELYPMFYDLEPDTVAMLRPLLERESTRSLLAAWGKECRIPWHVGLPWFARLTVYGADGRSRGHFRQWSWDDVVFRRELRVAEAPREGITMLRVDAPFALGKSILQAGDTLVARWPDLASVREIASAAARNEVYFRLPDAAASSGWSLRQFTARAGESSAPRLILKWDHDRLTLMNDGPHDLPPRMVGDGPQDRGYALEVDAPGVAFREALPGAFWRVAGHADPDAAKPLAVPIVAATRLTFWFSSLPAGRELRSGLLQLAPGAAWSALRYRILNIEPAPAWKSLEPSR